MSEEPTFSVVIPSYNYGHYLEETLDSVIDQGRADVQIVLVDDASDDHTPEIAKKYEGQIEYIRNDTNRGAGGAWAIGLPQARGRYVMKLDADDKLLPGFFEAVECAFEQDDEIGMVITSVLLHREKQGDIRKQLITDSNRVISADDLRKRLIHDFFFRMPGCVLKRAMLQGHELPDSQLYQIHDWEYMLRVTKSHKAALVREPLAQYRIHGSSITATAQQNDRLYRDITRWLELAEQPGERHIEPAQLRVLKGSCAALMLIGFGNKFDPKSYANYFSKYRKAFGLASSAGFAQLFRLHVALLGKIFRHLTFTANV